MSTSRGPGRRILRLGAAVGTGVLTLAIPASSVHAAAAEDVLEADSSLANEYDTGDHLVVRVVVRADQLIDGTIEMSIDGGTYSVVTDVNVAGGSSKQFVLMIPSNQMGGGRVTVELRDGGDLLDSDIVSFSHTADADVAGVLPKLRSKFADLPPRVTLIGDTKRVTVVDLPIGVLELGAPALSQLDSIAATSADLSDLTPTGREAVMAWLAKGGRLVLDDASDLSALPEKWRPTEVGFARAERGTVTIANGALADGKWEAAIEPASLSALDNLFGFRGNDMFMDPRITLSQRAGVQLPNLNKIIVTLGVYALVIGPIMYFILRRARRLTAAWVVIPVASILVAGGVVVTGSSWRTGGRPTASAIVELSDGGSYAFNDVLVLSGGAGRSTVDLPNGWKTSEQQSGWWFGGEMGQAAQNRHVVGDGAERLEVRLESGQIAMLSGEGAITGESLEVDARVDGDGNVQGTVTNNTAWPLQSVAALAAGSSAKVGDLAPGASGTFVLKRVKATLATETPVMQVWPNQQLAMMRGMAVGEQDEAPGVDFGIWTSFAGRRLNDLYPVGFVRIAGWTTARPSDVVGADPFSTTSLVTSLAPIEIDDGELRSFSVPWNFVEAPWDPNGQAGQPVIRYELPVAAVGRSLELELVNQIVEKAEVIGADGEWVEVVPRPDSRVIDVPPDAVRHGSLIVRFSINQINGWDPSVNLAELGGPAI